MKNDKIYVTPSRLHQFAFCPRQVFFDHYLKVKKPLRQRIRMLIGKLLHFIHHLFRPGYEKEKLMQVEIEDMGIVLVGKPDAFRLNSPVVEEFKSTRMPKVPNRWSVLAWESDMVQALVYAYMIKRLHGVSPNILIRYIDGVTTLEFNEQMEAILMQYLEEYKKMVDYKLFPDVPRNRRCNRCPYRELCDTIDYKVGEGESS